MENEHGLAVSGERQTPLHDNLSYWFKIEFFWMTDSGRDLKHWIEVDDQILKWWAQGVMNPDFARGRSSLVKRHNGKE